MSGYIGTQPVPQATQHRETFTATASQTSFATAGYTPQFLDVYLNGIHLLNPDDYTASNGSDVVLTTGAALDDVLEVISYSTYEVNSQNYTGGLTVDNSAATVLTVDRAGSDGSVIDVQKNGSTVGSIGSSNSDLMLGNSDVGLKFHDANDKIYPWNVGTDAIRDGGISLGDTGGRFKDLYLSGGVYLGGTGAANKLDDYEEGTCQLVHGGVNMTGEAHYEKIGRLVTVHFDVTSGVGSTTTNLIDGLPYAFEAPNGTVHVGFSTAAATIVGGYVSNTNFRFITAGSTSAQNLAAGERIIGVAIYKTAT